MAFKLKEIFTGEEEDTDSIDYEVKEPIKKMKEATSLISCSFLSIFLFFLVLFRNIKKYPHSYYHTSNTNYCI